METNVPNNVCDACTDLICLSSGTKHYSAWWSLDGQQRRCTSARVCWAHGIVSFLRPQWHNRFRTTGPDHCCLLYRLRLIKWLRWDNGYKLTDLKVIHNLNYKYFFSPRLSVKCHHQIDYQKKRQDFLIRIPGYFSHLLLAGQTESRPQTHAIGWVKWLNKQSNVIITMLCNTLQ